MTSHYSVIIIGGGQAGLSMSYCLKERGIDHIVFEKNQVGYAWREKRWDSFCLVTPNWQC
ncbi:MAG TPA: FAD-dependent monooxygenase, partial [Thermosynechococcaceae cyanobacterium]